MTDTTQNNPYVIMEGLEDFADELKNHMDFQAFSECLDLVVTFLARPKEAPSQRQVAAYITQLTAYGTIFRLQAASWMTWKKGVSNASAYKNTYMAMYHGIDELVAALKKWLPA